MLCSLASHPESGDGGVSLWERHERLEIEFPGTQTAVFAGHGFSRVKEKEVTLSHWEPVWTVFLGLTRCK